MRFLTPIFCSEVWTVIIHNPGLFAERSLPCEDRKVALFVTPQNLIEFWVVATRPVDSNGWG